MIPEDRRNQILDLLEKNHYMSVEDLADHLYVSLPTIRRDLTSLEKEGCIKRIHGGASFNHPSSFPSPYALKKKTNLDAKNKIGKKAASLIQNNDTLFITASSTCLSFVNHINPDFHLKVLTNGIPLAQTLSSYQGMIVECPPGIYHHNHESIFGPDVADYIQGRHAKYCFFSCNGFDLEHGVSFLVDVDISIVKACRKHCDQMVLLVDHTKLNQKYYYKALDFAEIDMLVTDRTLDKEWEKACEDHHIRIL